MDTKDQQPKKIALYLDDSRDVEQEIPDHKWVTVRNFVEFTAFISSYYKENRKLPDLISFDHDLSKEHVDYYLEHPNERLKDYSIFKEKTGMHAAQWLIAVCEKNNISLEAVKLCVHSHNPWGSTNIQSVLNAFKTKQLGPGMGDCFISKWKFKYNDSIIHDRQKDLEKEVLNENLQQEGGNT